MTSHDDSGPSVGGAAHWHAHALAGLNAGEFITLSTVLQLTTIPLWQTQILERALQDEEMFVSCNGRFLRPRRMVMPGKTIRVIIPAKIAYDGY